MHISLLYGDQHFAREHQNSHTQQCALYIDVGNCITTTFRRILLGFSREQNATSRSLSAGVLAPKTAHSSHRSTWLYTPSAKRARRETPLSHWS